MTNFIKKVQETSFTNQITLELLAMWYLLYGEIVRK